jgi:hypothetical protein
MDGMNWWITYVLHRTYGISGAERLALVSMVYDMDPDGFFSVSHEKIAVVLAVETKQAEGVVQSLVDKGFIQFHAEVNGQNFYRFPTSF